MKKILTYCSVAVFLYSCSTKNHWELTSPNKHVKISINLDQESGTLTYHAFLQKEDKYEIILNPSPLGMTTSKGDLSTNLSYVSETNATLVDEPFEMLSGKQKHYENKANEMSLTVSNPDKKELIIRWRAYDDGIAFRYEIPGEGELTIQSEASGFSIPQTGRAWLPNYDKVKPWAPAYETLYTNGSPVGENAPEGPGWSFPMLFETSESWMLISETNVYDYAGVHLDSVVENGTYKARFPEADERYSEGVSKPAVTLPMVSPWRFIIMGNDLNTIVNSGMVYRLAEPNKLEDTSWIKPGRASWPWWSGNGRNQKALEKFTDMSATLGWEYVLVDAGWQNIEGGSLEEVISYADSKGIDVLIWYNSGGRRGRENSLQELAIMEDPEKRRAELKRISELGVKGIKVDFFNSDKPHVMDQYKGILEDASDFKLHVNFHGCTLPRGWTRTYPHLLTMEAVKGGENYRYDEGFTKSAPWLHTIFFISRNTIGPMDYTPVIFSDSKNPHSTTFTHELATVVLFESGITHFPDTPEAYLSKSDEVKTFLSNVPVTWAELQLVDAYPGQYAVAARKSFDGVWYLAGINGEKTEKQLHLDLAFLEDGKSYSATTYTDEASRKIATGRVDEVQKNLNITLMPNGGFVYVIKEMSK